ncbi:F-box/kelch-repeat protein At3g06240-like [Mercurialis annua]|uniref:F-box/kelch-repeat protein At3g06240-like n=1 Tax=Mercurialis annua TaxID=3986 RepID=UPI0021610361|nr:F-box/kelch-repeat protein At3g06240-like [Mercurialis annua]
MRFDNRDFDDYLSLQPLFDPANDVYKVVLVGSNNGLVCLYYAYTKDPGSIHKLVIWNPSIRKLLLIPQPSPLFFSPSYEKLIGFGFDSRTDDYKLLLTRFSMNPIKDVVLYSLNSNSWKQITHVALNYTRGSNMPETTPAFVDGRFLWSVIADKG